MKGTNDIMFLLIISMCFIYLSIIVIDVIWGRQIFTHRVSHQKFLTDKQEKILLILLLILSLLFMSMVFIVSIQDGDSFLDAIWAVTRYSLLALIAPGTNAAILFSFILLYLNRKWKKREESEKS